MTETLQDRLMKLQVARAISIGPNGSVLFGRRAGSGLLEIPGGKIDTGETLLRAMIRETGEETGFDIQPVGPVLRVDCDVLRRRRNSPYHGFREVFAGMATIIGGTPILQTGETTEILMIAQDQLALHAQEMTPTTVRALGAFGLLESDLLADAAIRPYAMPVAA
jgi:8-oxo-dGTP pyrophosphatase MutT (NUDIX family)